MSNVDSGEWVCQYCKTPNNLILEVCSGCRSPMYSETSQPAPIPNSNESIHDLLVKEILARKELGLQRYGTLLQADNGRDALQDAIDEAIDLCVYLIQAREERNKWLISTQLTPKGHQHPQPGNNG